MEPITALAIGGGIMGGGSILGGIFGKKAADEQRKALDRLRSQAQSEYKQLAAYGLKEGDKILQGFLSERAANIAQYKPQYESLIADFDTRYAQLQTSYTAGMRDIYSVFEGGMQDMERQYREGMQNAYQTAASGRENTIAAIRRATESSIGRATQMQQVTGLAGTTFGQSALGGIAQEGAMREGVVQEQYASQLAGMQERMTGGLTDIARARIAGGTSLMQERVAGERQLGLGAMTGSIGMRGDLLQQILGAAQQTTATGTAMRENMMTRYMTQEQARIGAILGIGQQQAASSGAGWAAASGAMGGVASGLGGAFMTAGLMGALGGMGGGGTSASTGGAFSLPQGGVGPTVNPFG
jgi:hypothetical protein